MRITNLTYKNFNFLFSSSLTNSNQKFQHKETIILMAVDELNNIHYGEVSPLVGFSNEIIEDCKREIEDLINDSFFIDEISAIKSKLNNQNISPSLGFGIEQIVLSLELMYSSEFYAENYRFMDVVSNGLVGIKTLSQTLQEITHLIDNNFGTIKLKVGRDNFDEDFATVKSINDRFSSQIKLRLDVNGKWSYDEAMYNIKKLSPFNIEYIEQPVKEKNELITLAKEFGDIIVPDECIETMQDAIELIDSGLLKFIVLKPSIRFGLFGTIKITEHANSMNVNVIITSAFETIIGRSTLLFLASITNHTFAHGLSPELLGKENINADTDYSKSVIPFDIKTFPPSINLL